MPAYNVEKYIGKAIESILNQTYAHFELLICDDGSTDKTVEVIKTYTDSRIKLFQNKSNKGNLKTTNFLLDQCQGDFIAIQDADDYSEINRFEIQIAAFKDNPKLGIVGSYYQLIDSNDTVFLGGVLPNSQNEIALVMEKEVAPFLYPSIMVKKTIVDKIGHFQLFFNRKGYADFDWMARICEKSEALNLPTPLYFYRRHSGSFTMIASKKKQKELFKYMHYLLVQAHKDRIIGKIDFFKKNDKKSIKKRIALKQLNELKIEFWDHQTINFKLIFRAIWNNPFELSPYKDILFILRKK